MTVVERLIEEMRQLQPSERVALREWLVDFDDDEWDLQMEADAKAGKLDQLAADALADLKAGRTRELKCDA